MSKPEDDRDRPEGYYWIKTWPTAPWEIWRLDSTVVGSTPEGREIWSNLHGTCELGTPEVVGPKIEEPSGGWAWYCAWTAAWYDIGDAIRDEQLAKRGVTEFWEAHQKRLKEFLEKEDND